MLCGEIEDPYQHASDLYGGSFIRDTLTTVNRWSNAMVFHTTSEFSIDANGVVRKNHCGPTAITNIAFALANAKGITGISSETPLDFFTTVVDIETSGLGLPIYYNSGGTLNALAGNYIKDVFASYDVSVTTTKKVATSTNFIETFRPGDLAYLMLLGDRTYGNHHVVGFGILALYSSTTGQGVDYLL